MTAQEANAESALLDLKNRFKCFCFSLSINHNFEKLRENPRLINGKVDSNPPLLHIILILYNHDNIVTIKFRNLDQRKFLIEYRYFGQN